MKNILLFILCIFLFFSCGEIKQPPGVFAPDIPIQENITTSKTWDKNDYHFTALAKFELRAKVLGKERYRYDRESDIAPYDLALGWGRCQIKQLLIRLI